MALAPGTRLGPYEVVGALGAGGMGEVYRARDTRLDRSVAIKVLPVALAGDPARRSRFEREAKAVAALDHPHICGIYDVGEADGTHFLVMPLVDGQTLAARLQKGPLPLDQALKVASELADALDKAHRAGLVHRDVKPANIMLTKAGAKLLDFGLAKLQAPAAPISLSGMTQLATTTPGTAEGVILGTVPYMAPEQVEGKEADARSDIWALGVVLYQMVTGARPFAGETPASVIGSILKDRPQPVSMRAPLAPRALDHLVSTCLEKDPDDRWQTARDVLHELTWVQDRNAHLTAPVPGRRRVPILVLGVSVLVAALAGSALTWRTTSVPAATAETMRFEIQPPPGATWSPSPIASAAQLVLSPDGSQLAFAATLRHGPSQLWVRPLASTTAQPLSGTEGALFPFWSPDSRSLGFFSGGKLKTIALSGGAPRTLADAANPRGGTWGRNGDIVFTPAPNGPTFRVSPSGVVTQETAFANEVVTQYFPQFLPDGRRFLFYQRSVTPDSNGIYVKTLGTADQRLLFQHNGMGVYASGHLFFVREAILYAVDVDEEALEVSGEPQRVADGVGYFGGTFGYAAITASTAGTLAHGPGALVTTSLIWRDRSGAVSGAVGTPGGYRSPRLSPDQRAVAVTIVDPQSQSPDIWILDATSGGSSRVTSDPRNDWFPIWAPGGERLFFSSTRAGSSTLYEKATAAPGQGEPVTETQFSGMYASDVTHDGSTVLAFQTTNTFSMPNAGGGYDLVTIPLAGDRKPHAFLASPFNEVQGRLSPNGRWIAYASDESGRFEVYVRPYPSGNGQWPISSGGGMQPEWRGDGKELFFISGDGHLMAAEVTTAPPTFSASVPRALFAVEVPEPAAPFSTDYAITADGQRFLINTVVEQPVRPSLTVILNWAPARPES
jgi:serine/threonine protein kinase